MTREEQLERWVKGESTHSDDDDGGTCCPDFSCCEPSLKAPKEERERFRKAYVACDGQTTDAMLMMFLTAGINKMNEGKEEPVDIHLTGFVYE